MTYKQDFLVYRPVLPESATQLQFLQDEYAAMHSFVPVENLQLTLLNGHTEKVLSIAALRRVVNDAPKSSAESYDTEIIGARLDKRSDDLTRVALRLVLNDEESSQYFNEHEIFKQSAKAIDNTLRMRYFASPRVTLGYLDAADGLDSVKETAEALAGNYLSFGPIESNVGPMHTPVDTVQYAKQVKRRIVLDEPVRTVKPGVVPQGLLASLRPRT